MDRIAPAPAVVPHGLFARGERAGHAFAWHIETDPTEQE